MSSPRIEGVAAVAVVGIPDEKWGEAVTAIVVPREDVVLDVARIDRPREG